jgi:hypothetical protein
MELLKYSFLAIGFTIIYPIENVRVRMGGEIGRDRIYRSIKDCIRKMRKTEGVSSFFRGFALSLPLILLQYGASLNIYNYLIKHK